MTNVNLVRLKAFTAAIHSILVLLVVIGLGFQVYTFTEYKSDVRENRDLLCKAPALAKTEYCTLVQYTDGVKLVTKENQ